MAGLSVMCAPFRILLVDDNPDDRELIIRELQKEPADLDIQHIIDQAEWNAALDARQMDVVVCDYHLRWSDGVTILRDLKSQYPHCPMIMFTASGTEEVAVEAMKLGLDDYIIKKPSHLRRLRGSLASVLRKLETHKQMQALDGRLSSILNNLSVGVFRCSLQGDYLETSQSMCTLMGHSQSENSECLPFSIVEALMPSELNWSECIEALRNSSGTFSKDIIFKNAFGSMFWGKLDLTLSQTVSGERVIDGLLEDVSDRVQLETRALEQAVARTKISQLTSQEKKVFDGVVAGKQNKMIAVDLDLSEKTIEKHRAKMMKRLNVKSVAELVKIAAAAADLKPAVDENPKSNSA